MTSGLRQGRGQAVCSPRCALSVVLILTAAALPAVGQATEAQGARVSTPTGGIATPRPVIGVIDQQRVMAESTAARSINAQKEKFQDIYQAFTAEEEKRLRVLDEGLSADRASLSPELFNTRMADFQGQVTEFQKLLQQKRRNLERSYAQAITEVQNTVIRLTDEIAAERGMNIVLYRSQVFLFDPKLDVTNDVVTRLNRVLPSVTMADPEKLEAEKPATKKGGR